MQNDKTDTIFPDEDADFIETSAKPRLEIIGHDGNAFVILGRAQRVARNNRMDWEKIEKEATSGDYDHLLVTMNKYFEVC